MTYEVKKGFTSGYSLVFTAFQPNGTGRGLAYQFLPEVYNHGYYRAVPATDLVVGDIVLVYSQEKVYYDDALVVYLAYEHVLYEDEYVYYEGAHVIDYDTQSNEAVVWIENPIGVGEYESVIDRDAILDEITEHQSIVNNVEDLRDGDGVAGAGVTTETFIDC